MTDAASRTYRVTSPGSAQQWQRFLMDLAANGDVQDTVRRWNGRDINEWEEVGHE